MTRQQHRQRQMTGHAVAQAVAGEVEHADAHRHVLADDGADKAEAQPIVGLWEPYRPERFYYEVVECGRRIMLTGVTVFIFPNDAAQVAITMLLTFFFFGVFSFAVLFVFRLAVAAPPSETAAAGRSLGRPAVVASSSSFLDP